MKVFIDLDGVLTDLVSSSIRIVGLDPKTFVYPLGMYDICEALGVKDEWFWNKLTDNEKFWSEMEWMFDGREILNIIKNHFQGPQHQLCLLSSPSNCHYSLSGKSKWIQTNLDKKWHRQFLFGPCKEMCAGSNSLLIDDSENNCNKFEQAGGNAILLPRLWNRLYAFHYEANNYLKKELEKYV